MTNAIWLTVGFYVIFAPASTLLQAWLVNGDVLNLFMIDHLDWHELIGTAICMILNLGLEYPFQRFIVFGKTIDTAKFYEILAQILTLPSEFIAKIRKTAPNVIITSIT